MYVAAMISLDIMFYSYLLQQSDIHHLMYHLYNLSPSDLPVENIYHFRKRAKALLDNWFAMLLGDVKNRNWAFQGQNSIYYICSNHCKLKVLSYLLWCSICLSLRWQILYSRDSRFARARGFGMDDLWTKFLPFEIFEGLVWHVGLFNGFGLMQIWEMGVIYYFDL